MQITKPIVKRKIRGVKFIRNGRGFSKAELNEVGIINISIAKSSGVPVDLLRKTKNPENVEQLKLIAKAALIITVHPYACLSLVVMHKILV
jgi:ribosomal protein L13E